MNARLSALALLLVVALYPVSVASAESQATRRSTVTNPFVTGSFLDESNGQGVFSGNWKLAPFELRGGTLVAVGRLTGVLSDSTGEAIGRVDQEIAWPVESVAGTCETVQLRFAGTDASLLHVTVRFEPLELDVTAGTARAKRTRELLCSVSQLAKSDAAAGDLTSKLNDLFHSLR